MKKIKLFLMAFVACVSLSCSSGGGNYVSVVENFVETASAYNKEVSETMENYYKNRGKGATIDKDKLTKDGEKCMSTLMSISCYNDELMTDENKSSMQDKTGKKMSKIEMVSYEITKTLELRDGTVAYVEVEMLKKEGGSKRTEEFILKNINGHWKVEVSNWGKDLFDLKDEIKAKLAE